MWFITLAKENLQSFTRLASRGIIVSAVFLFVLAVYLRLMGTPGLGIDMQNIQKEQREEFIKVFLKKETLPEEVQTALGIQQLAYCRLTGDFCHTDIRKITQIDIDNSLSSQLADAFLIPLLNMPPSGIHTTLDTIAQAGLVPQSYAASGIGLGSVSAYSEVWKQMRNVAFLLLVLFVLAAGFIIMFGSAVNANTAVKVENVLPKIIVTMIVIQFSLTLVGFLVDLMYIACALVIAVLGPLVDPTISQISLIDKYVYSSPVSIFTAVTGPGGFFGNVYKIMYQIPDHLLSILGVQMRYVFRIVIAGIGIIALWPSLSSISSTSINNVKSVVSFFSSIGGVLGKVLAGSTVIIAVLILLWKVLPIIVFLFLPQLVIGVILLFAIFVSGFKILKLILFSYISILLLTIFAPLILIQDIIPGRSGFKPWFMGIMRELATFPILIATVLVSYLILSVQLTGAGLKLPFMFGINPQAFAYLVGISIMTMSPKLIEEAKTAIFGRPYSLGGDAYGTLLQGLPYTTWIPGMSRVKTLLDKTAPKPSDAKKLDDLRKLFGP